MKKGTVILDNVWHREEEIWKRFGEEDMVVQQISMDGVELQGKNMRLKGMERNRKGAEKIFEMGFGSRMEDTEVHGMGGVAERENENEDCFKGMEI